MRAVFWSLVCLGALGEAHAQVKVEPIEAPKPIAEVFGGSPAAFRVSVEAPAGAKVTLTYDLLQVTDQLVAPFETGKSLGPPLVFDQAGLRSIPIEIPAPEVTGRSRFLARIQADGLQEKDSAPRAVATLDVYPAPKPGERAAGLAKTQERSGIRLAVCGESAALRAFLAAEGIAFVDLGPEFPEEAGADRLVAAEVPARKLGSLRTGRLRRALFLVPDSPLPPGVYERQAEDRVLTKVTLPVLDGIATNPPRQHLLIDLLHQNLHTAESSDNP